MKTRFKRKFGKWLLGIAIAFDQLGASLLPERAAGEWTVNPDETISSRIGRSIVVHGGTLPWWSPFRKIINWGLHKIDRYHSEDAIEWDELTEPQLEEMRLALKDPEVANSLLQHLGEDRYWEIRKQLGLVV